MNCEFCTSVICFDSTDNCQLKRKENEMEKGMNAAPVKMFKVMVDNFYGPLKNGDILKKTETGYKPNIEAFQIARWPADFIEAQPEKYLAPLSADGLTRKEMLKAHNEGKEIQAINAAENFWLNSNGSFVRVTNHLEQYRLKPAPKTIDVPDGVKILNIVTGLSIINGERQLCISNDGLPIVWYCDKSETTPAIIICEPVTEFKDVEIYYRHGILGSKDEDMGKFEELYQVYCKKTNCMYYWSKENDYTYLSIKNPLLSDYYKVIAKEA